MDDCLLYVESDGITVPSDVAVTEEPPGIFHLRRDEQHLWGPLDIPGVPEHLRGLAAARAAGSA